MSPSTRLLMDHAQAFFSSRVQWNLNLMDFCITKSSVLQMISPQIFGKEPQCNRTSLCWTYFVCPLALWVSLVRFHVNKARALKMKMLASGLLIVHLNLLFRSEGEIHICKSGEKVNNNETTHSRKNCINIARAQQCTAVILFDFPD